VPELLEHRRRIGDQEDMSSLRNAGLRQWLTVLLTITAWLILSNHCALGVVTLPVETGVEAGGCPMHSAPAKKEPPMKIPCCKDLRAVAVEGAAGVMSAAIRIVGPQDHAAEIFVFPPHVSIEIAGLDTGPPSAFSFAESVLQQSLLAHAPPVS
jgi:hypothetical protein